MKKQLVILLFLFMSIAGFAQKKYIAHEVKKGETLYSLAIKYNISIKKIIKYNPDISEATGIQEGKLLIIQTKTKEESSAGFRTHLVKKRETLFGLSKKYKVSEEAIQKANPIIAEKGLMCGLQLRIPDENISLPPDVPNPPKEIGADEHIVQAKETIFSITHQYGISEELLRKLNPQIQGNDLPIGMVLKIKAAEPEVSLVKIDTIYTKHLVLPKETVYGITHLYDIDKEQLVRLNPNFPALKDNVVHPDDVLVVKMLVVKSDENTQQIDSLYVGVKTPLLSRIKFGKHIDMALLLPVNVPAYNLSSSDSLQQVLQHNVGLNRVLDYRNGALMAVDSIAKLGISVHVDVYDTETKNSVALLKLIREGKLANKDLIVGPFYTENVALVAQQITDDKTIIIAPFNRKAIASAKVLNTKIAKNKQQEKMVEYLKNNHTDEQLIYIDDEANLAAKAFFLANFKDVIVLNPHEKTKAVPFNKIAEAVGLQKTRSGQIVPIETLKANKKYWVIVNSKADWFIGSVISAFNSLQDKADITLFSTGYYKAFHNINPNHLANLNYHFPAYSNIDAEDAVFNSKYYIKYGVRPSTYVIKGFDATFDTLLRIAASEGNLSEALLYENNKGISQQFQYRKSALGNYENEGIQILRYTKDLHQVTAEPLNKE